MPRLLIIADDFTGALDSGVQFSKAGALTLITTNIGCLSDAAFLDAGVVAVDTESRHDLPARAAEKVRLLTERAVALGIPYVYKKIDSTMRGNVGSELAAFLEACGQTELPLIPAYPKLGRTTVGGAQFVSEVSLLDSNFAADPFNPVLSSSVEQVLRHNFEGGSGAGVSVMNITTEQSRSGGWSAPKEKTISVFDAKDDGDLLAISDSLEARGELRFTSGSAGFAGILAGRLRFGIKKPAPKSVGGKTLIISGSVNELALRQLRAAEEAGLCCYTLPCNKIRSDKAAYAAGRARIFGQLRDSLNSRGLAALRTDGGKDPSRISGGGGLEDDSKLIADELGQLAGELLAAGDIATLVVIGGDTLWGIMENLGCETLEATEELLPGVVAARLCGGTFGGEIVAKAGGFGGEDTLLEIIRRRCNL